MFLYHYYIIVNNKKKYVVLQILLLLLNFVIVKGCHLFYQEDTDLSIIYIISLMQVIYVIQYIYTFLCFKKEMFRNNICMIDKLLINIKEKKIYQLKQQQFLIVYISGLLEQIMFAALLKFQMSEISLLISINVVGFLLLQLLYTGNWFHVYINEEPMWKKSMDTAIIMMLIYIFNNTNKHLIYLISIFLILKLIAEKLYIGRKINDKNTKSDSLL